MRRLYLVCVLLLAGCPGLAAEHFVAPPAAAASAAADGRRASPWPSLAAAFGSGRIEGGDTITLLAGDHGRIVLANKRYAPALRIRGEPGGGTHLETLEIIGGGGLILSDFDIWPTGGVEQGQYLVHSRHGATDLVFERLDVRSDRAAPEEMFTWSREDWLGPYRYNGLRFDNGGNTVRDSRFTGLAFGVVAMSSGVIEGNEVNGFSGDGLRALGNGAVVRRNLVRNCFDVDSNHDDGFQSWATRTPEGESQKVQSGLVLDGNRFIEWDGPEGHPLHGKLQGIGLFDGVYRDLTIINNLVEITAWHGISVFGGQNVLIANNTVTSLDGIAADRPWIGVYDHKNGVPSENVRVFNNIASAFVNKSTGGVRIPLEYNLRERYPARSFRDVLADDYRLKPGLPPASGAWSAALPDHDIDGRPRPQGAGGDLGAFETAE